MKKSTLFATIAAFITMYLLNFLFYALGGMTEQYMTDAGEAASRGMEAMMLPLVLGHLVMAYFLALVYSKWARGTHSFPLGMRYGAALGAAFGLGLNLIWYATADVMSLNGHLVDSAWQIVSLGIVGGVIAVVTDKFEDGE